MQPAAMVAAGLVIVKWRALPMDAAWALDSSKRIGAASLRRRLHAGMV